MSACNNPPRSRCQGFSLLELLVAFVIFSLVGGAVLQLFGQHLKGISVAEKHSRAVTIAQSILERVGKDIPVQEGETSNPTDFPPYRSAVRVSKVEITDIAVDQYELPSQLYRVDVEVTWSEGQKERFFILKTLRFGDE